MKIRALSSKTTFLCIVLNNLNVFYVNILYDDR
jgi:hypothetical protein